MKQQKDLKSAWNQFQGKMRTLRKEQKQVIKNFQNKLEQNRIAKLRKELKS